MNLMGRGSMTRVDLAGAAADARSPRTGRGWDGFRKIKCRLRHLRC